MCFFKRLIFFSAFLSVFILKHCKHICLKLCALISASLRGFLTHKRPNTGLVWKQGAVFQALCREKRNRVMILFPRPDIGAQILIACVSCLLSSDETTLLTQSHNKMCPFQYEISVNVIHTALPCFLILCVFIQAVQKPVSELARKQATFRLFF